MALKNETTKSTVLYVLLFKKQPKYFLKWLYQLIFTPATYADIHFFHIPVSIWYYGYLSLKLS